MDASKVLGVATRRRIFECVGDHPGAHLRDVSRRARVPLGTTLYHLDRLAAAGLVVARRDGRYKRYFSARGLGRHEKDILSILRHDAPRRIVQALIRHGACTQRELSVHVERSRSTTSFHVSHMERAGLVARTAVRPEATYQLIDSEAVARLLGRFGGSLESVRSAPPAVAWASGSIPLEVEA